MNPININQKIMTPKEVSRIFKIPLSTIYYLTKKGKIKAIRIGKHWRYLEAEIQKYFSGMPSFLPPPDKRSDSRFNCTLPVKFNVLLKGENESKLGTIRNLSASGTFLEQAHPNGVRVGDLVKIVFEIDSVTFELKGQVIHQSQSGSGLGIRFKDITALQERILREYAT